MFVNYRSLIASWWGGIGLGTVGAGGYWAYDTKNPRVSQWVLDSGYILNPPELTGNQGKIWDCSENIFKEDPGFDENKLYACGSASINIWNNGDEKGGRINYLTFISEFLIRKGNDGWKIKTQFDNRAGDARYDHQVIIYKKNSLWAEIENDWKDVSVPTQKRLSIKMPNGKWFDGNDYSNKISEVVNGTVTMKETYESFKKNKSWSGIWIEDSNSSPSWIFQDIEIFIEDKKYSQVFCKEEQSGECYKQHDDDDVWINSKFTPNQMINQISSSKGKWSDAEKICKVGNKRKRSISAEHQKSLRMFCSKPKNSLLETSN